MGIPNNYYRNSVKALIWDESRTKLLLFKEIHGVWCLPGGGIEYGENPIVALKRELKEESGLKVCEVNTKPIIYYTYKGVKNIWRSVVVYETKIADFEIKKSDECVDAKYFSLNQTKKLNMSGGLKEFIKLYNNNYLLSS